MIVPIEEYPVNRPWDEKVFSMPNIPRGDKGILFILRDILEKVQAHSPSKEFLNYEGSSSRITLEEACVRLRPMRLVLKTANGWEISQESKRWLETEDNLYLAAILCANIRFVGEVLYYLDTPRKSTDLKEIALRDYGLGWKTISDINSRLVWLRQLQLVDFQEFSLLYSITELGKEFLKTIKIVDAGQITHQEDDTAKEDSVEIAQWALACCNLDQQQLSTRKQTIGYIPGMISDFNNVIYEYLSLIQSGASYDSVKKYAQENYNIATSSIKGFMSTLTNMGLIMRHTDDRYVLTDLGSDWISDGEIKALICCIHSKFAFVFEMLNELNGQTLSYKELAAIGKVSYGLDKANIEEVRKRVAIFKSAKLVRNISLDKFTITKRGQLLLGKFHLQDKRLTQVTKKSENAKTEKINSIITELRLASNDSMNPDRFEWAIQNAFEQLGFISKRLGGSGKTDVLIHTPGSPKVAFSVAIDAKSTASDSVTDSLVDFDTLTEHRKKHHANYSMVVGCAFKNERIIKRAAEHNVVLMDVDTLETLIKHHTEVPIPLNSYRTVFEQSGLADISAVECKRQELLRYGELMRSVMKCLVQESEDPITEGFLFERDIYRSLRDLKEIQELPTIEEVSNMLQFLASPLIGCVEKTKEGYYATGSLADAARKFEFYSEFCEKVQ